ncbi:hypothetical protein [Tautonia sociabilis]|uniref:Uncharacterized protein n=1 Tax=Tautonia sociabilis TaxID=2080755 RepID=A0A432MHY4_9BACT|nr:hypothetical protein [Tautonia sociabilis]RUL86972.1 hypothetical protein TsocGM_14340 [Tautonia sociabilis]
MSRYKFKGRDPRHTIVIGWDNPLETFFAQVWDGEPADDDGVELWVGCEIGEIEDVEELVEIVAPYAEIPAEVVAKLVEDQRSWISARLKLIRR